MIDFRSDTVTKPTAAMKDAMFSAPLGDDVFGEDPTVNALQEKAAKIFGQEAALFCPSGTMTNQIAIKVHCQPGDEVICDHLSHIYNYEGGGIAMNSGASVRLVQGDMGRFTGADVQENINPDDAHYASTTLVSVENTCNKGGGSCYDLAALQDISKVAKENNLKFHLDGARLFNAIVAKDYSPYELGQQFDSISICLSKGLGCPSGSLLLGSTSFIKKAHRVRKVFGGGMRQAGFLAAAGIYALDHHVNRLSHDHRLAQFIGAEIAQLSYVKEVFSVETNIIIFKTATAVQPKLLAYLEANDVLAVPFGPGKIRLVTHHEITDLMADDALSILKQFKA